MGNIYKRQVDAFARWKSYVESEDNLVEDEEVLWKVENCKREVEKQQVGTPEQTGNLYEKNGRHEVNKQK